MSDSLSPHRRQPTMLPRPWGSPGKNTEEGCHFLLQCMKVKRESEVTQSCPTLHDPMDCSLPHSSVHGIFQARVLEWDAIAFSDLLFWFIQKGGRSTIKKKASGRMNGLTRPGLGTGTHYYQLIVLPKIGYKARPD